MLAGGTPVPPVRLSPLLVLPVGGSAHQFASHLSTNPVAHMASLRNPESTGKSSMQPRQMASVSRVMIVDSDGVASRSRERNKQS